MEKYKLYSITAVLIIIQIFTASALTFHARAESSQNQKASSAMVEKEAASTSSTTNAQVNASESASTEIDKRSRDVIQAWVWRIVKRFQTAMDRLANIADRMNSRLAKMQKNNLEQEKANKIKAKISKARRDISSAGDHIILAAAEIKQVSKGTPAAEAFSKFKKYTNDSQSKLKNAKQNLIEALKIMKSAKEPSS